MRTNQVRIIGGRHRGRKLRFPDLPGLRPSGDRSRETLFNWLQPWIEGARCLDLFAGSGALGFEAASRGAARVVLVEKAAKAVRQLQENADSLGDVPVEVVQADAPAWLESAPGPFDLVFLDPPFAADLLPKVLETLLRPGLLGAGARIYLETDAGKGLPNLPAGFAWDRRKRMGQVEFGLLVPVKRQASYSACPA